MISHEVTTESYPVTGEICSAEKSDINMQFFVCETCYFGEHKHGVWGKSSSEVVCRCKGNLVQGCV